MFVEALPRLDTTRGLIDASVAVAAHELPSVEPEMTQAAIETLAQCVRERAPRLVAPLGPERAVLSPVDASGVEPLLAHLHETLFEEEGYRGATDDYYHPINSYLPAVMEMRRGLPVTLTLLYKAVAERLGLVVEGINAPGHFMAGVRKDPAGAGCELLLVDVFDGGRMLTCDEALQRIETIGGGAVGDPNAALATAAHSDWIARIIQNLIAVFRHDDRERDAAAMLELRGLLVEDD